MIRSFRSSDADEVDRIAVAAFAEHSSSYSDWPQLRDRLARMSEHATEAEVLVAELGGRLVGAVLYVAPHRPRPAHFDPDWAVMRMLAVDPACRGLGLGKSLADACVSCAVRDRAEILALHTSPMMGAALGVYRRMGFSFLRKAPTNFGAECSILAKRLIP